MGMLATLVGSRLPPRYQRFFKLPERESSWKPDDTDDTVLGRAVAAWFAANAANAGVYRLNLGREALEARLGLIDHAEKTIDIQSYLIKDDISGNLVALHLAAAADRGVRVRLLMDDALTSEIDSGLLSLSGHINIQVRVFNPFPRRRSRLISLIANFNILNRRMHNKSFTVDNQVTIVGGRNLADEYFRQGGASEFIDEDLLAIGSVVDDVSEGFDEYWNSSEAIPIEAFGNLVAHMTVNDFIEAGRAYVERFRESDYLRAIDGLLVERLLNGRLPMVGASAEVILDHPEKIRNLARWRGSVVIDYLRKMVSAANTELIVISPYFVPQKQGVDFFGALVEKGVRVVIVSNSLASTNHTSVHAVYARYRRPLLRRGVELYELRPRLDAADAATTLTLHSKVAVVDRERLFVGSFNLDPRSLYLNTEMGMTVVSPTLAGATATDILASLEELAYKLQLSSKGKLRWLLRAGGVEEIITTEPQTTFWRRFKTKLMSFLPIEGQL